MTTVPVFTARKRACTHCGSDEIYRQRPRGLIERHVARACSNCAFHGSGVTLTLASLKPQVERSIIRTNCRDLRKWILFLRPANSLSLLLQIGDIECSAISASPNELASIRIDLMQLADKVRSAGARARGLSLENS